MKKCLLPLACLLLSACASMESPPAPQTAVAQAHTQTCKDSLYAWMDCYQQHGAHCDAAGRTN